MSLSRRTRMLIAALLVGAGAPMVVVPPLLRTDRKVDVQAEAVKPQRAVPTGKPFPRLFTYPNGPGWSAAHVKRLARKARNVRRHKAACKGARSRV